MYDRTADLGLADATRRAGFAGLHRNVSGKAEARHQFLPERSLTAARLTAEKDGVKPSM